MEKLQQSIIPSLWSLAETLGRATTDHVQWPCLVRCICSWTGSGVTYLIKNVLCCATYYICPHMVMLMYFSIIIELLFLFAVGLLLINSLFDEGFPSHLSVVLCASRASSLDHAVWVCCQRLGWSFGFQHLASKAFNLLGFIWPWLM